GTHIDPRAAQTDHRGERHGQPTLRAPIGKRPAGSLTTSCRADAGRGALNSVVGRIPIQSAPRPDSGLASRGAAGKTAGPSTPDVSSPSGDVQIDPGSLME